MARLTTHQGGISVFYVIVSRTQGSTAAQVILKENQVEIKTVKL